MISRLRRRFVVISGISVILVFSGIFLLLCLFTWDQMNRTMDTLTDAIASNNGVFPEFDADRQSPPRYSFPYGDVIDEETRFSTRFFTVWLDGKGQVRSVNMDAVSSIAETEVEAYAARALSEERERGWVSDYRYKVTDTGGETFIVFVNGSMNQHTTARLQFTSFLILLGSAGMILVLTILLSGRAVRPVAEGYEKQRQFITDANHELKTPLTLILSNLDIVGSEVGKNEWLDDIRSEGERMVRLINQMLTLSRMDESDARVEQFPFDLSAALLDTVSEFQNLARERGRELSARVEPGVIYRGDEALIRRLISALLDNAVKYCDAGGTIQAGLTRRRHPVITVENTFAGVDGLELDRLFDRFYRADKARTSSDSFGVGLSIARAIAKNHRGSIEAYRRDRIIGFRVELR